jgi:rRNA maturation endonuclease Nob1
MWNGTPIFEAWPCVRLLSSTSEASDFVWRGALQKRKQMADPKEEAKVEKKVEETSKATHDDELSDADIETVAGGVGTGTEKLGTV